MQQLLAGYIPVSDASDRLQAGKDADCLLFQKFARQPLTIPSRVRGTGGGANEIGVRQGIYAVAPSGALLASANTPDPREVAAVLRQGQEKWKTLTRAQRLMAREPDPGTAAQWARWDRLYPADGLVLRATYRDLPRPNIPEHWRGAWNRDYTWIRKEEARRLVPSVLKVGESQTAPREVMDRLARFALVDNVRARNYDAYPAESIETADLKATVTRLEGKLVTLKLEGASRTSVPPPAARGYDATLLGTAVWDREREKFTAWELVAVGPRWGAGNCNQRGDDLGPAPMGVLLTLAGDSAADRLPPAFIKQYGWQ